MAYTSIIRMPFAKCWGLPPVILATQEAEIRRIVVQSQPGQNVHKTYLENPIKKGADEVAQV
jgi:hypothetical protein